MKKLKICDTHNDFLTELAPYEFAGYIEKSRKNGAEIICASFWNSKIEENKIKNELLQRAHALRSIKSEYLLHIEDLWWIKNQEDLNFLLAINPFSCSLTWNDDNSLAGGAHGNGALTEWGKECIKKINEAGIIIDLAHLNRKSFYNAIKIIDKNLYCSHTGFYGVKRHKRNLTDKQIDVIVKSNGFIGLFFFDKCIKRDKNSEFCIKNIVENLKYFTSHWGYDNIGIGSDFYGIDNYPKGLSDYSDFGNLYDALLQEGYTERQINKIFYKNFMEFLSRNKNR